MFIGLHCRIFIECILFSRFEVHKRIDRQRKLLGSYLLLLSLLSGKERPPPVDLPGKTRPECADWRSECCCINCVGVREKPTIMRWWWWRRWLGRPLESLYLDVAGQVSRNKSLGEPSEEESQRKI